MTMPYDEITSLIGEMKQTEDETERLEQEKERIGKKIATAFADRLNAVYRDWRPKIGERVVVADFRSSPPYLFEVVVRVVDGNRCKMTRTLTDNRNYLVLLLDEELCDYDIPLLTFPMDEYVKLRGKLDLPDFQPLLQI